MLIGLCLIDPTENCYKNLEWNVPSLSTSSLYYQVAKNTLLSVTFLTTINVIAVYHKCVFIL